MPEHLGGAFVGGSQITQGFAESAEVIDQCFGGVTVGIKLLLQQAKHFRLPRGGFAQAGKGVVERPFPPPGMIEMLRHDLDQPGVLPVDFRQRIKRAGQSFEVFEQLIGLLVLCFQVRPDLTNEAHDLVDSLRKLRRGRLGLPVSSLERGLVNERWCRCIIPPGSFSQGRGLRAADIHFNRLSAGEQASEVLKNRHRSPFRRSLTGHSAGLARYDAPMHRGNTTGLWLLMAFLAIVVAGCGRTPSSPSDIDVPTPDAAELRVVSFSPALTRIAVDLGMSDVIIGRTPWCTSVDSDVPVVGQLDDADFELLVRLDPTHVLVQPSAIGVHPELERLAREKNWVIISDRVNGIADIQSVTGEIVSALSTAAPARADAMRATYEQWQEELDLILTPLSELPASGSTLIVLSGDPVLAFGQQTYLGDVIDRFGLENELEQTGWVELTLEDVSRLNPDLLIIVTTADVQSAFIDGVLGPLESLPIEAIRAKRWIVLDHADALIPSTSVLEVAAELRQKLTALLGREP